VTTNPLDNTHLPRCRSDCLLQDSFVYRMPSLLSRPGVFAELRRRQYPLPLPFSGRVWVLPRQGIGPVSFSLATLQVLFMELANVFKVRGKRSFDESRQPRYSILTAFSLAHDDLSGSAINIFHAQPQTLPQPPASPVQQGGPDPVNAATRTPQGPDFLSSSYHRETVRLFCPDNVGEPAEVEIKDLSVQKEQGAQGLVLGRSAHMAVDCPRGQELRDFPFAHVSRMTLAMKEDKPLAPVNVGIFGP